MLLYILIFIILLSSVAREHFTLAYNVEYSPHVFTISNRVDLSQYVSKISNMKQVADTPQADIIDALNVKNPIITILPHRCILVIVGPKTKNSIEQLLRSKNIVTNNTVFTQYFLNMYNINKTPTISQKYDPKAIHIFYETASVISNFLKEAEDYEFYEYPIKIHELKASIPFIRSDVFDMSILFKGYRSRFPSRRLICIDLCVTAASVTGFEYEIYEFVSLIGNVTVNNYYTQFFEFSPITLQYLSKYNSYYQNRDKLPILEQFDNRFDTRYVCYERPDLFTKKLCLEAGEIWDRPCEKDDECPFNDTKRGGCYDGFCELPIGVERKSFRQHNSKTKPIGKGCPLDNLYCNSTKAFELETFVDQTLKTYLSRELEMDVINTQIHRETVKGDEVIIFATSIVQKEGEDYGYAIYTETLHGPNTDKLLKYTIREKLFDDTINLTHPPLRFPQ